MRGRLFLVSSSLALIAAVAFAQQPAREPGASTDSRWRTASRGDESAADDRSRPAGGDLQPITAPPRRGIARVTQGPGTLPNDDGQVWREYDLSPYCLRVTSTNTPEQAVVDWILRETGYETWHSEIVSILSADNRTLRAYHTPEIQAVVAEVVDRFVNREAESHGFSLRVVTIENPNWRVKALPLLKPVEVESQTVQAWLLEKEDAALLIAELRKRSDFREHSAPQLLVNNGQSAVVASTRARNYIRDVKLRSDAWPGFENQVGQIDEGFSLEMAPLLSLDGRVIDAVLKCHIDQVEKLVPVMLEVPTPVAPRQRTRLEVPQVAQFRIHERFRWPVDQVLVIGLGVVPTPAPKDPNVLVRNLPFMGAAPRADLLVFVESKGTSGATGDAYDRGATQRAKTYGRY